MWMENFTVQTRQIYITEKKTQNTDVKCLNIPLRFGEDLFWNIWTPEQQSGLQVTVKVQVLTEMSGLTVSASVGSSAHLKHWFRSLKDASA